jgi:hypothetical protein
MVHKQPPSGAAQQAARILRSLTAGRPLCFERELTGGRPQGRAVACCSSLELERWELLESIVESLSGSRPPDCTEAPLELLRHLAGGGAEHRRRGLGDPQLHRSDARATVGNQERPVR